MAGRMSVAEKLEIWQLVARRGVVSDNRPATGSFGCLDPPVRRTDWWDPAAGAQQGAVRWSACEREEISRGLAAGESLRCIAAQLGQTWTRPTCPRRGSLAQSVCPHASGSSWRGHVSTRTWAVPARRGHRTPSRSAARANSGRHRVVHLRLLADPQRPAVAASAARAGPGCPRGRGSGLAREYASGDQRRSWPLVGRRS